MIPLTITDVRAVPGDSAFLLDDGTTAVLYDTGYGFTGYAIADKVQQLLGDRPLDYILLTHSHYDHALGSTCLRQRYPQVQIIAGAYADIIFRKPTARAVMRDLDQKAAAANGVTDYQDLTDTLCAHRTVVDGDVIQCGQMQFTVLELPGHTKCSIGFYLAENQLLLGTETLGVYFGEGLFHPSFLVGYQMTLDSIQKAKALEIRQILVPHYGVVSDREAQTYLLQSEIVTKEIAHLILDQLKQGKSSEEIFSQLTDLLYIDRVKPTYPYTAYRMNSMIIINQVQKELFCQ